MARIAQNGQKRLISILVLSLRIENIKERWKKIKRYIHSIQIIFKLKWKSPLNSNSGILNSLIHCLFNSGSSTL